VYKNTSLLNCKLCCQLYWVRLGPSFSTCSGLGWVSQLIGWVGLGHTKWTHGQLCVQRTALLVWAAHLLAMIREVAPLGCSTSADRSSETGWNDAGDATPPRSPRSLLLYSIGSSVARVVSVLDSGAEGLGFKSQSRRCQITVLGKLFTPVTKQGNW